MKRRTKRILKRFTVLAIVSVFCFEQVGWAGYLPLASGTWSVGGGTWEKSFYDPQSMIHDPSGAMTYAERHTTWDGLKFVGEKLGLIQPAAPSVVAIGPGSMLNPISVATKSLPPPNVWMNTAKSITAAMVEQGVAVAAAETFDSPILAAVVSSAIGGGLHGRDLFASATTGATIGGVRELGERQGWDPALTNVAALTAGQIVNISLAPMKVNVQNPATGMMETQTLSFEQAMAKVVIPDLAQNLAYVGIQKLGDQLGWDPAITNLAALPISIGIGSTIRGDSGTTIADAISSGLQKGITSLVLSQAYGGDVSLADAVTSRTITGAIEGTLNGEGIFAGIANALAQSTLSAITHEGSGDFVHHIAETIEFAQIAKEKGLEQAIDEYATSIFLRDSVESMVRSGETIAERIKEARARAKQAALADGRTVQEMEVLAGNALIKLWLDATTGEVLVVEEVLADGTIRRQEGIFVVDKRDGRVVLKEGRIEETRSDKTKFVAEVKDYQVSQVKILTLQVSEIGGMQEYVEQWTITPMNPGSSVWIDEFGEVVEGRLKDLENGIEVYIRDKKILTIQVDTTGKLQDVTGEVNIGEYEEVQAPSVPAGTIPVLENLSAEVKVLKPEVVNSPEFNQKILPFAYKAAQVVNAVEAQSGGFRFERVMRNGKSYVIAFGDESKNRLLKINGRFYRTTHESVAKFLSPGGAMKDYAKTFVKKGLPVGTYLVISEDLIRGVAEGKSVSELGADVIVDGGISIVSGGAVALGTGFGGSISGANPVVAIGTGIATGEIVSSILKEIAEKLELKEKAADLFEGLDEYFEEDQ